MEKQTFQEKLEALKEIDINDLDFENFGTWPTAVKIVACILLFVAALFGGYKFDTEELQRVLAQEAQKEVQLKQEFEAKAFKAANLPLLKAQMTEMEESFGALVAQLPSDTEVPGLLEDISNRGESARLEFDSFILLSEITKEFYIELPIEIQVRGTYHDMGSFVSGVAALPRIVTLHDFKITPDSKSTVGLRMDIIAKTYRYKEDEE